MREPVYEQELGKQGVQWALEEKVRLDKVNVRASLAMQARLTEPLDMAVVGAYEAGYRDGTEYPPLVAFKKAGRYVLLDGNRRYAAAVRAGRKVHDIYVVDCDDRGVLERIAWTFNKVNGERPHPDDALEHAVSFVRRHGWDYGQAAAECGVPEWKVKQRVNNDVLKERLKAGDVRVDRLSEYALQKMYPLLEQGDDVLIPFAKAVVGTGATTAEIEELSQRVRKARDHKAKVVAIGEYESSDRAAKRRAATKGGRLRTPVSPRPPEQLERAMREVVRVVESFPERRGFLPAGAADVRKARQLALDVVEKLRMVYGLATLEQLGGVG
jgi:hypothetical protein